MMTRARPLATTPQAGDGSVYRRRPVFTLASEQAHVNPSVPAV